MGDYISRAIASFFESLLYYIGSFLCEIVDFMYMLFQKFAGVEPVTYRNGKISMFDVLFGNSQIKTIYWGMATIGTILTIFFAILAVTKKSVDIDDKMKSSHSGILRGAFKSIMIIVSMNFILVGTISATNVLLEQVSYLFNNAPALSQVTEITYTEEQFATMARVCNTIGNHALSPSRLNRYNINSCYNEIREDMLKLERQHVFDIDYEVYKEQTQNSWQYVLSKVAASMDLSQEASANVYYESLETAMEEAFVVIDNNNNFYPLRQYSVPAAPAITNSNTPFGAMLFLSATFDASKKGLNGSKASLTDSVRGKYITGSKDYTNKDDVESDFDLDFSKFNHLTLIIAAIFIGRQFIEILIDCIVRIFNLLLLYLSEPLFASTLPLDEGSKFRQWTLSFVIQSFSIIGVVMTLRLYMLFIPIVMSSDLVILDSSFGNMIAKVIFMIAGAMAVKGASRLITSILAEQAGMSAIHAGSVGGQVTSKLSNMATSLGKDVFGSSGGKNKSAANKKGEEKGKEEENKDSKGSEGGEGGKDGTGSSSGDSGHLSKSAAGEINKGATEATGGSGKDAKLPGTAAADKGGGGDKGGESAGDALKGSAAGGEGGDSDGGSGGGSSDDGFEGRKRSGSVSNPSRGSLSLDDPDDSGPEPAGRGRSYSVGGDPSDEPGNSDGGEGEPLEDMQDSNAESLPGPADAGDKADAKDDKEDDKKGEEDDDDEPGIIARAGLGALKHAANAASALASMAATGEASDGFVNDMIGQHNSNNKKKKKQAAEEASKKKANGGEKAAKGANNGSAPAKKTIPVPQSAEAKNTSSGNPSSESPKVDQSSDNSSPRRRV